MSSTHYPEIRPPAAPVGVRLLDLLMGSWRAGVVSTFAELGIADALRADALTAGHLATRTGLEREACHRFCRAAVAVGLLSADADGALRPTDLGHALATDAPESMRNFARWCGSTAERATWAHLHTAVRTGRSPFTAIHGAGVWDFFATQPDTATVFDAAMTELSQRIIRPVVDALDLSSCTSVTDVGGGRGALLSAILTQNPHLDGVLFDQAEVVARAPQVLEEAGVADRVTIRSGSFFHGVPAGSDMFVISNVLHDWDDEHARAILRAVAAAMSPGHRIAVVEAVVGVDERFDEPIALMDMDMLTLCDGKQRTVEDLSVLLAELKIDVDGVGRAGLQSVIHATKVD